MNEFLTGYLECALWSSCDDHDEPLDSNYTVDDIGGATLESMTEDCREFLASHKCELDESGLGMSEAGHCLWLNRNCHGSGFWDRGNDPVFRTLSNGAKGMGTVDLYAGDDGRVHSS